MERRSESECTSTTLPAGGRSSDACCEGRKRKKQKTSVVVEGVSLFHFVHCNIVIKAGATHLRLWSLPGRCRGVIHGSRGRRDLRHDARLCVPLRLTSHIAQKTIKGLEKCPPRPRRFCSAGHWRRRLSWLLGGAPITIQQCKRTTPLPPPY